MAGWDGLGVRSGGCLLKASSTPSPGAWGYPGTAFTIVGTVPLGGGLVFYLLAQDGRHSGQDPKSVSTYNQPTL
jgi:hypothetical protein